MIGLHPKSDKIVYGNNLSFGLGVINFDATIESLETKGIKFHIEQDDWIRLACFSDPDGNELFLVENK